MLRMRLSGKTLVILLIFIATTAARENVQCRRGITPEDILRIRQVSDPQISPNGKRVAFVVTEPADPNQPGLPGNSDIWIVPSDGSRSPRRYAFSPKQERMPRWSPDSKYLAFLSNRGTDKKFQIYLIPTIGGEAEFITQAKEDVVKFKWLSDSSTIAYVSKDALTSEEEDKLKAKNDTRVLDKCFKYQRLYEINLASKEVTLVTKQDVNIKGFNYSPDNNQVVLVNSITPKLDDVSVNSQITIINRDGSYWKVLSNKVHGSACWSQDGQQIFYLAAIGKVHAKHPCHICVEGGSPNILVPNYKGTIWEIDRIPESQSLLVSCQNGVQGAISVIDLESGKIKNLKKVGRPYGGGPCWSINADGNLIAYVDASYDSPRDVWIMKSDGSDAKRLTNMNPQTNSLAFGIQEVIQWTSRDGMFIEGILVKPIDYKKGQRYPLVVQVHGGPAWAWWDGWLSYGHVWAPLLAK